jgi:hypothetical protein
MKATQGKVSDVSEVSKGLNGFQPGPGGRKVWMVKVARKKQVRFVPTASETSETSKTSVTIGNLANLRHL